MYSRPVDFFKIMDRLHSSKPANQKSNQNQIKTQFYWRDRPRFFILGFFVFFFSFFSLQKICKISRFWSKLKKIWLLFYNLKKKIFENLLFQNFSTKNVRFWGNFSVFRVVIFATRKKKCPDGPTLLGRSVCS